MKMHFNSKVKLMVEMYLTMSQESRANSCLDKRKVKTFSTMQHKNIGSGSGYVECNAVWKIGVDFLKITK